MKVLIVCGYGTQPSENYFGYILAPLRLVRECGYDVVVLAGGRTNMSRPGVSEAQLMYDVWQEDGAFTGEFGVHLFEYSRTLEENIIGAHQVLWHEYGLEGIEQVDVYVRSTHAMKALYYVKRVFGWKGVGVKSYSFGSFFDFLLQTFVALPFEWLASKIGFVARWRMRLRIKRMENS